VETKKQIRAALYARVSTGRQAERDLSIPDQIRQMEEYCQAKGWAIYKKYVEAGASARDEHRPVFQEMLADAKSKERPFDVVVTLTTSRFFRDVLGAQVYKANLAKLGVKVVAAHQEVKDDPTGTFIETIFEAVDAYESNMNNFHTLRAMKENARQGYYNGSRPKFGFMVVEDGQGSD
jgi:site-specific DNA recombinase